ncbi:MAG: acetylglutamate kinase [Candidatus Velthaea sp.]
MQDVEAGERDCAVVVKFGGSVARGAGGDPVLRDVAALAGAGTPVVIVHGGGPAVDAECESRGIAPRRLAGLRVTDAATLAVVEDVLGRRINAAVVAAVGRAGGRAVRVAGDEGVFTAERLRHPEGDLGFVGSVASVDAAAVRAVLAAGRIPVVSPVGADRAGQRYNINADTAAGALAAALRAAAYVVVTDVDRVRLDRSDPATGLARLTSAEVEAHAARGVFGDGMIPKMEAAVAAVRGGAVRAVICGAGAGDVPRALAGGGGTEIVP